jgi:hypothetical protein
VKQDDNSLVTINARAGVFIVFTTVDIRGIVERAVAMADRTATALIGKMPIEACIRPMLLALMLLELDARFTSELFQVSI